MECAEQFLTARSILSLAVSIKVALEKFEKHLALVFKEHLVLGNLADWEQVGDEALVQSNLVVEGEVDGEGVEQSLHVAQLIVFSDLLDVHHVVKAEESINVDAGLQVAR